MAGLRPRVFIGSSGEGKGIADAIQVNLDKSCEVEIWSQGVFGLSRGNLESLSLALNGFDFAILVLTADDLVAKRDVAKPAARDNVIFEAGFFLGGLGRGRTFMVYDRTNPADLPSDLAGITCATYESHASGKLVPALGAACTTILAEIDNLGVRDPERSKIEQAKRTFSRSESIETRLSPAAVQYPISDAQRSAFKSRLLICFATVGSGFDTGIAVINHNTADAAGDSAEVCGKLTFVFYPQTGSPFMYVTSSTSPGSGLDDQGILQAGRTYVVLLAQLLASAGANAPFTGFVVIQSTFANAFATAVAGNFVTLTHSVEVRRI